MDQLNSTATKFFIPATPERVPRPDVNLSALGPIELLYHAADTALDAVQGAMPAGVMLDFVESVNWREPFILGVLGFQVAVFALVMQLRRKMAPSCGVLFAILGFVYAAESLNTFGKNNWERFATQDYFDTPGLFMTIFYAGPLLIDANIILVLLFLNIATMGARSQILKKRAEQRGATTSQAAKPVQEKKND